MMDFNEPDNKGFFIVGSLIGLFSTTNNMMLGEFFPLIMLKAITIASLSGFFGIMGKRIFEKITKYNKKSK